MRNVLTLDDLTEVVATSIAGVWSYRRAAVEFYLGILPGAGDDEIPAAPGRLVTNSEDEPLGYVDHAGETFHYNGHTFTPVTITAGGRSWTGIATAAGESFVARCVD